MAAFDDLVGKVADDGLRRLLKDAFAKATKNKKFGLVYEEHLPEASLTSPAAP